ncbi:MAG: PP2C family protein-serine/threonine phosphatase [Anaerolineae bacterium]
MGVEIQVAVAKVGKYATSESGDTVEMIERPHGGLSLVLADGQRSGRGAKAISNLVARKAISLLAEGVRDGAVARATHDYLYTYRGGKVQATPNIVSVDLATHTIVVSRNSHCPVIVITEEGLKTLDEPSQPIGVYPRTKPVITELPLTPYTYLIVFTDGILASARSGLEPNTSYGGWAASACDLDAGQRYGKKINLAQLITDRLAQGSPTAQALADGILEQAMALDQGRPTDDMSVLVLAILPRDREDDVRRMTVSFPIDGR